MTDSTLAEISKIVLALPKVETAIIQETHSLEQKNVVRVPSGEGFIKGAVRKSEYRVFVSTSDNAPKGGKVHADRSGPDLINVIRTVLAEVKIDMPRL